MKLKEAEKAVELAKRAESLARQAKELREMAVAGGIRRIALVVYPAPKDKTKGEIDKALHYFIDDIHYAEPLVKEVSYILASSGEGCIQEAKLLGLDVE